MREATNCTIDNRINVKENVAKKYSSIAITLAANSVRSLSESSLYPIVCEASRISSVASGKYLAARSVCRKQNRRF